MTSIRVLKWAVPVDDQFHPIGGGKVVHVSTLDAVSPVYIWTEEEVDKFETVHPPTRHTCIYGTGHSIPPLLEHIGTTVFGSMVWHAYAEPTR